MMAELMDAVVSLPTLVVALIVFGFAPGAVLRVIVLAFHRDDPRRKELSAELYAVPRWERPFWVFEQIEVALSEGLWGRARWAMAGRVTYRWKLRSGVESHEKYPETFQIPGEEDKRDLASGVVVKLSFEVRAFGGERMWVQVDEVADDGVVIGTLVNQPETIPRLYAGDTVKFTRDHILDIDWDPAPLNSEPQRWRFCKCCIAEHHECTGSYVPEK